MANHNNFKLGLITVYDITNGILQKSDLLFGKSFNVKHEAFLRLENKGFRIANPSISEISTIWDTVTANYFAKIDLTTKVGLEVIFTYILRFH